MIKFLVFILISFWVSSLWAGSVIHKQVIYGKSERGLDLKANVFFAGNTSHRDLIILSEGVHGNEYIGIVNNINQNLSAPSLPQKLNDYFSEGGVIVTFPQVNPDAIKYKKRLMKDGRDLNRLFAMAEGPPEARFLKKFIHGFIDETKLNVLFSIDYHCCGGAALLPKNVHNDHESFYQTVGLVAKSVFSKSFQVVKTAIFFGKTFEGTLKDYFLKLTHAPSITFEVEDINVKKKQEHQKQLMFLDALVGNIKNNPHSQRELTHMSYSNVSIDDYFNKKNYSE